MEDHSVGEVTITSKGLSVFVERPEGHFIEIQLSEKRDKFVSQIGEYDELEEAVKDASRRRFKLSADCPPCECCEEPWCSDCEMHYAECSCLGPHID